MWARALTLAVVVAAVAGSSAIRGRAATGEPIPGVVALLAAAVPRDQLYQAQFCAGVQIGGREVLTAAHCVAERNAADLTVLVGGDNLCRGQPIAGRLIAVESVTIDAAYATNTRAFDLAVLVLAESFAGVPRRIASAARPGEATAYGWGIGNAGAPTCTLERVRLRIRDQSECLQLFEDSSRRFDPTSMICATQLGDGNTCRGDSGGPLFIGTDADHSAQLAGIVSWGLGCAGPGAYARVDHSTAADGPEAAD
jgi:secreted trypsin-like serine protease